MPLACNRHGTIKQADVYEDRGFENVQVAGSKLAANFSKAPKCLANEMKMRIARDESYGILGLPNSPLKEGVRSSVVL